MRPIRIIELVAVLALVGPGGRLVAQQQSPAPPTAPAKTGKAEISGVVVDSLHGRYLRGADVIIEGSKARLVTDSVGRFRIDSLPPGTYQVGVFHPLLDTLGIALATRPFHAGADSTISVTFAVPPAATIIRRACPPPSPDQGNSAVIGHVNDPETLQPVAGAEVSIAWIRIEISKQVGIRHTPHVVRDTTTEAGAFTICGLPSSLDANLQARKGAFATSEIPISLGHADSELLARTLLLSLSDSGVRVGTATVSGRVVLEGATPRAGSRVELVGTDAVALTNEKGEFTMTKLPSGSHVLLARHLGYAAETVPVDLSAREPQTVTLTLPKFVSMMDPVLVMARRNVSLDRVGFSQRKKSGSGYFLGPEQLQRMHAFRLTDILRRVPGLRVSYTPSGDVVSSSRGVTSMGGGECVQYFLDDMPWHSVSPGDISTFVNASEVVAVEVYQGAHVPAQYSRGMGCTTIVLWTRLRVPGLSER